MSRYQKCQMWLGTTGKQCGVRIEPDYEGTDDDLCLECRTEFARQRTDREKTT